MEIKAENIIPREMYDSWSHPCEPKKLDVDLKLGSRGAVRWETIVPIAI